MDTRRTYYWFTSLGGAGFGFIATTYVLFLQKLHCTYAEILILNTAFLATIVAAELPTGMCADGKSRAWSIRMGALVSSLAFFVYGLANNFWGALIAEIMEGVAAAFLSGALSAWLNDALAKEESEDKEALSKVKGRGTMLRGSAHLVAGILGAGISLWNERVVWYLGAILMFASYLVAWRGMDGVRGEPEERVTESQALRKSWTAFRESRALGWAIGCSLVFCFVMPFNYYWQPYFSGQFGFQGLVWLWVPLQIGMVGSGVWLRYQRTIEKKMKNKRREEAPSVIFSLLLSGLGLVGIALMPGIAGALVFTVIHEIGRGLHEPSIDLYTRHHVESSYRATYGSLHSFLQRLGSTIFLGILSLITFHLPSTQFTIVWTWVVCGTLLILLSIFLWWKRPQENP